MRWFLILTAVILSFLPVGVLAGDDSDEVVVVAVPYVGDEVSGFTVTYVSDTQVDLEWTYGFSVTNVLIRAKYGSAPEDTSDGYLVYYGNGLSVSDTSMNFDEYLGTLYYRIWGETDPGVYPTSDTGQVEGYVVLLLTIIGLACFFTWFSSRRPEILVSISAGFVWLGLAFWVMLDHTRFDLSEPLWAILIWVFVALAFVPWLVQMNMEIKHEKNGHSWSIYASEPPRKQGTPYEDYRDKLYGRTRLLRGRKRR